MDGVGAGLLRGVEDAIDAQVALARRRGTDRHGVVGVDDVERGTVGVGVNGDGGIAELAAGADHAHGDLAAVGHENFHGAHCKGRREAEDGGLSEAQRCTMPEGRGIST